VADRHALEHARAVIATVEETSAGGLSYLRAQLPRDYDALFGDPARPPPEATVRR
jgi:hypothetical protein